MTGDRQLIDAIKTQFARKSSAQLESIIQASNDNRWAAEAAAAAGEVLEDRVSGRATEPAEAEEELAPPPFHYEPGEIALGVLGGLLTGHLIIPYHKMAEVESPDLPIPFGPRMAWLTLDTTDTEAAAAALGLDEAEKATWAEGIAAAYRGSAFVTPPLGDWTLALRRFRANASAPWTTTASPNAAGTMS